jgi:hypothetical protein
MAWFAAGNSRRTSSLDSLVSCDAQLVLSLNLHNYTGIVVNNICCAVIFAFTAEGAQHQKVSRPDDGVRYIEERCIYF